MKALFIINPLAGGYDRSAEVIYAVRKAVSSEKGIFEIKVTREKGHARRLAKEAVEKRFDVVFACGGDGTVNEVASSLVKTRALLGIIPTGSGNALAGALNVPEDPVAAIGLLNGRRTVEVDAGIFCGRYFFSTAGLGFDAVLSKRYGEGFLSRRFRGTLPYIPLALLEFPRFRPASFRIKTGKGDMRITPFILTAANTPNYGGRYVIAPGANPFDGSLDVCVIANVNPVNAPVLAYKFLKGRIHTFKGYSRIIACSLDIVSDSRVIAHVDGEPFECAGEISIRVLHKGLKALAG